MDSSFNKQLINNVKLFHSQNNEDACEEKYSFIKYVFSNIESISCQDIDICEEEFENLNTNIDAYYYEEDSHVYNLYIAIYSDNLDDQDFLSKNQIDLYYKKIINFVDKTISGKYIGFGESSFTFEIAKELNKLINQNEIVINVVSNFNIPSAYKKDSIESISGVDVSFRTYDLSDLKNKFSQLTNESAVLDCFDNFGQSINALKVFNSIDFDVYLFAMKGIWLARLYKDDSSRLLEQNVRSYLKRTAKVNAGILETVKTNADQFISFNNGISAVATNITSINEQDQEFITKITAIDNFQIVNGGQTTATLYECFKDKLINELEDVMVPVKMTVVKNIGYSEDFIRSISVYSNTQTAIKKSDPPSNLPYYIQIKKLSQTCLSNNEDGEYICYFERTLGEYQTEVRRNNSSKKFLKTNPKNKKFDKIDLARAINSWEQTPYVTCQGKEKNFALFNDIVKNQLNVPDELYFKKAYALIIIYRSLDKLAKKLNLSVKSNVVAYTLSFISLAYDKQLDLLEIWNLKEIGEELTRFAIETMPKINEIIMKASSSQPEPRMWARKKECWDSIQKINFSTPITKQGSKTEFFVKNDALIYISNDSNFYNTLTWMKVLLWDNKYHVLSKSQISIVKHMRQSANCLSKPLTLKQVSFLKDTFLLAVKRGYNYK